MQAAQHRPRLASPAAPRRGGAGSGSGLRSLRAGGGEVRGERGAAFLEGLGRSLPLCSSAGAGGGGAPREPPPPPHTRGRQGWRCRRERLQAGWQGGIEPPCAHCGGGSGAESPAVVPSPSKIIGYRDEGCCVLVSDLLTRARRPTKVRVSRSRVV